MKNFSSLFSKSASYKKCFTDGMGNLTVDGQRVIKDLMAFCNVNKSTMSVNTVTGRVDALSMALEEGRRTVFQRIRSYINLDEAKLRKAQELNDNNNF